MTWRGKKATPIRMKWNGAICFCDTLYIAKADELPVHNRKGVGNQKEKGGGDFFDLKLEQALSAHWATLCGCLGFLTF